MNALDVILFVIALLFVIYLIILAASEPRYAWRDVATFEDKIRELEQQVFEMKKKIGDRIMPILSEFADALSKFGDANER